MGSSVPVSAKLLFQVKQEIGVAKITIFRPDGQRSYEKIAITSIENGVVMFSVPGTNNQFETLSVTTNVPFVIEGEREQ
ncbi:MAG: hypothetical protein ACLPVW_05650 [Terriglobales bacterium]